MRSIRQFMCWPSRWGVLREFICLFWVMFVLTIRQLEMCFTILILTILCLRGKFAANTAKHPLMELPVPQTQIHKLKFHYPLGPITTSSRAPFVPPSSPPSELWRTPKYVNPTTPHTFLEYRRANKKIGRVTTIFECMDRMSWRENAIWGMLARWDERCWIWGVKLVGWELLRMRLIEWFMRLVWKEIVILLHWIIITFPRVFAPVSMRVSYHCFACVADFDVHNFIIDALSLLRQFTQ